MGESLDFGTGIDGLQLLCDDTSSILVVLFFFPLNCINTCQSYSDLGVFFNLVLITKILHFQTHLCTPVALHRHTKKKVI